MSDNRIKLHDQTLRDGQQSLWGMMMSHGMIEPVIGEIAHAGYDVITTPSLAFNGVVFVRFYKEDPWESFRVYAKKIKGTQSVVHSGVGLGMLLNPFGLPECKAIIRLAFQLMKNILGEPFKICAFLTCTRDEVKRDADIFFPLMRSMGIEPVPYLTYAADNPRYTDEFYAKAVDKITSKYKPVQIVLKDVDGLLTVERAKTLIPAIQKNAHGVPIVMHVHGVSGQQTAVCAEAMRLGVRDFHTCIPPLAYGSSHASVHNIVHNAKVLGIPVPDMDFEKLKIVEERLTNIGRQAGFPVDNHPLPYDAAAYVHKIPGGVMSTLTTQLKQLGMLDRLDEVVEEIPRILKELGHPIMITPFSQWIVSQATINVATGERWKEPLDALVDFATGLHGVEETGVNEMDQNLKDNLLARPYARKAIAKFEMQQEYMNSDPPISELKAKHGMPNATDEDFMLYYIMQGHEEIKKMREVAAGGPDTYKKYYLGNEPLSEILDGMKKDNKLKGLQIQRGNSLFEIRQVK